jgi:pimeloyl-ACP methyl ester carboxylesterase
MEQKLKHLCHQGLVIALILSITASCSQSGAQDVGLATHVDEFTAFNPDTGLPLKPQDLTAEMLKEDEQVKPQGDIQTMEIHQNDVDVKKAQDILLLGYTPDGSYNGQLSPQCYHTEVEKMVSSYEGYTSNLAQNLQSWANRCQKELSVGQTNNISTVIKFANVKYAMTENTLKSLDFSFEDNSKIKGLLAMKPGKRPLVIFKTGVYTNAVDDGVARNFFMHLFEESPFHILYLANVTGSDYMKDNGAVALGGMEEGRQLVKIVEMISHDPLYKDSIEDIHIVGVSLGSHGVLYSSLYNSYDANSTSKIKSVVALCPVVNLQPTIKSVFEPTVAGTYYAYLTRNIFMEVYDSIPILREYLPRGGFWSQSQMYNASTKATLWHYREATEKTPLDMVPFEGERVQQLEDFWELNNFIKYADQVTTPTLIVHSKDDFLVQSVLNSDELLKKTQNNNSQIGIVEFDHGSHCGLNIATGWQTMSSMLRSYVLKHSSYKAEAGEKFAVNFKAPTMTSNHKISKFTFTAFKDESKADVKIDYFDGALSAEGKSCKRYDPLFAPDLCYRKKTEKVDLNALADVGIKVPKSEFETQRLTRWLNTHATLLNQNSELILGKNLWPTSIDIDTKVDFQK